MSTEDEVVKHSDIIYWYRHGANLMQTKFIKDRSTKPKKTKHDLGYMYNIFLFKEKGFEIDEFEKFVAIIGDSTAYVERMMTIGYSGVMVKRAAHKKEPIKLALRQILHTFGFCEKDIKTHIKEAK